MHYSSPFNTSKISSTRKNSACWQINISVDFYLTLVLFKFPDVQSHGRQTGGVRHEIRLIRMRYLLSDFRAWEEPFSEVYMVKFSLYSKLV